MSQAAYTRLIELGIPAVPYLDDQERREKLRSQYPNGQVVFDYEDPNSDPPKYRTERYWDYWTHELENRTHPLVVQVVEELGTAASDHLSDLRVADVPDGVDYRIEAYDGLEHIAEGRTW